MLIISAVNKKGEHSLGDVFKAESGSSSLCKRSLPSRAGSHSPPPRHCSGRPGARPGSPQGNPKSLAGEGEGGIRGVTARLPPEENNACLPESKRQHAQTQMPVGSGSRRLPAAEEEGMGCRGGRGLPPEGPPPSGRVVASQPAWAQGGHPGAAEGAPKAPRFCRWGGGRKRGICSSWEGGPRRKKEEKEEID